MSRTSLGAAIVAVCLPALLAGCVWGGPALYGEDQAQTPVAAGTYRATVDNEPTSGTVTISGKATLVAIDGQAPARVLLIPLAVEGRRIWITEAPTGPDRREFAYGLIERTATGWGTEPYIACAGTEAIVHAAGGMVEAGGSPRGAGDMGPDDRVCVFRTKVALETALRAWLRSHAITGTLASAAIQ